MSEQVAQLKVAINDLRRKRDTLEKSLCDDVEEADALKAQILQLTQRLETVEKGIQKKKIAQLEYEETIGETEAAYQKILETSQTLLEVMHNTR